jgi:spore coat assembly protein SafA
MVATYIVQPGDTLSGIADRFGVTLLALEQANPQITNPNLIHPGEVVYIPARYRTYIVQPGDTLSGIAVKFEVGLADLEKVNPQITDPDVIHPGQLINIPG